MRRSTPPDPQVAAELELLDAVLEGRASDPAIELVAATVRADAPDLPSGLDRRLRTAIAEGFAGQDRGQRRRAWLTPALGGLAAVAVAVVIALPAVRGGEDEESAGTSSSGSAAMQQRPAPVPESAGGATAQDSAASGAPLLQRAAPGPRRVRRAADLVLATPLADLQETSDAVARTADRLGGRVQRSGVTASEEAGEATFDLRVPAGRLDEALAALAKLAEVRSRSQSSRDITARFTAVRERLADARAERRALLRALAAATTGAEIESLRARLDLASGRIEAAKAGLSRVRRTASLARVGVTVIGLAGNDEGRADEGGGWTLGRALDDAAGLLTVVAGVLLVAGAGALPLIVVGLLAWPAVRVHRRRRREGALRQGAAPV